MNTSTDLNKIVIYTQHAKRRMNQRAITKELIEFIIEYADNTFTSVKIKMAKNITLLAKRKYQIC